MFPLRGCNVQSKSNQLWWVITSKLSIFGFHLFNFNYVAPFNSEVLCRLTVSGFVGWTTCTISYLCSWMSLCCLKMEILQWFTLWKQIHERWRMWKEGFGECWYSIAMTEPKTLLHEPWVIAWKRFSSEITLPEPSWTFRPRNLTYEACSNTSRPEGRSSKHECVVNLSTSCRTFVNSVFIWWI